MVNRIDHGDDLRAAAETAQQQLADTTKEPHWLAISCGLAADGQLTVRETTVKMDERAIERALLQLIALLKPQQESSAPMIPLPAADLDMAELAHETASAAE